MLILVLFLSWLMLQVFLTNMALPTSSFHVKFILNNFMLTTELHIFVSLSSKVNHRVAIITTTEIMKTSLLSSLTTKLSHVKCSRHKTYIRYRLASKRNFWAFGNECLLVYIIVILSHSCVKNCLQMHTFLNLLSHLSMQESRSTWRSSVSEENEFLRVQVEYVLPF